MGQPSNTRTLDSRYRQCKGTLAARGQEHVLRWWDELSLPAREHLLGEIESIPWAHVDPLIESHVRNKPRESVPTDLQPAPVYPRVPTGARVVYYQEARQLGEELLRAGKVAAFTVAGGQGTRLGIDGPKGAVAISPIRKKTFFQLFAEMVLAARTRYGAGIRWYIMTSSANHQQALDFLGQHEFFGLPQNDVILFKQGMLPTFDLEGRILMESKDHPALSPDGHGGSLRALARSGALRDMQRRGIEVISYFQVDNPLVKPFDPLFIGLHARTGSEMSSKVTPKSDDFERVGNVCLHYGRTVVIEYSDFPKELAQARHPDGSRRFDVGNLAMHLLAVSFVERVVAHRFKLPYHRAEKAVASLDERGFLQTPRTPNAVKLETFVFDALPLAQNPLLLEIDRAEEFSPVKKPAGEDSLQTATRDQVRRAARWLEAAGARVPRAASGEPDCTLEIAPSRALDAADLCFSDQPLPSVPPGGSLYLE